MVLSLYFSLLHLSSPVKLGRRQRITLKVLRMTIKMVRVVFFYLLPQILFASLSALSEKVKGKNDIFCSPMSNQEAGEMSGRCVICFGGKLLVWQ